MLEPDTASNECSYITCAVCNYDRRRHSFARYTSVHFTGGFFQPPKVFVAKVNHYFFNLTKYFTIFEPENPPINDFFCSYKNGKKRLFNREMLGREFLQTKKLNAWTELIVLFTIINK